MIELLAIGKSFVSVIILTCHYHQFKTYDAIKIILLISIVFGVLLKPADFNIRSL